MILNQGIRLIIVGRTITPIKEDNLEMQSSFYSWRNIQPTDEQMRDIAAAGAAVMLYGPGAVNPTLLAALVAHIAFVLSKELAIASIPGPIACSWQAIAEDVSVAHSSSQSAGTTVAHGLTKEQALQLITLNPAKILGIDAMYGTLEAGKSATLFISEGDALDMRTNIISHAFIDGRLLSLETHQTELWKRYSEKYSN